MKDLKTNYGTIYHVILDCHSRKLPKIFQDAQTENMLTHDYNFFLTSLDIHILEPQDDAFTSVNVTAFRLVDPASPKLQVIIDSWRYRSAVSNRRPNYFGEDPFLSGNFPKTPSDLSAVPNLTYNMLLVSLGFYFEVNT